MTCGTWLYRFLIFAPLLTFTSQTSENKGSPWTFWKTFSQQGSLAWSTLKEECISLIFKYRSVYCWCWQNTPSLWPGCYFGSWGYLIIAIIEGQAMMHTICRKTKANAFGDFAYDFTEYWIKKRCLLSFIPEPFHERCIEWWSESLRSIHHLIKAEMPFFWKLGSISFNKAKFDALLSNGQN